MGQFGKNFHPRATIPLEMLSESLNEILMTVKFSMQFRKGYDSEFWGVTEKNDGILGFPSCMLLFSIVDTLGGYFENNPEFKISVKGLSEPQIINNENNTHFYILNSHLFNLNLSNGDIKRLYECRTSLLHNSVLTDGVILREANEKDFIEKVKFKEKTFLSVGITDFYYACEDAVETFFNNPIVINRPLKHRTKFLYKGISNEKGLRELTNGEFWAMRTS